MNSVSYLLALRCVVRLWDVDFSAVINGFLPGLSTLAEGGIIISGSMERSDEIMQRSVALSLIVDHPKLTDHLYRGRMRQY
jgi:hypothetical protein